ncbi:MAG: hypothetical protein RJA60_676, partial [Actinomycetota bacterium]
EKPRGGRDGGRANSGRPGGQSGANHKDGGNRGDKDRRRGGDRPHKSTGEKSEGSTPKAETHGGGEHQRPATPRTRNRTRTRGGSNPA